MPLPEYLAERIRNANLTPEVMGDVAVLVAQYNRISDQLEGLRIAEARSVPGKWGFAEGVEFVLYKNLPMEQRMAAYETVHGVDHSGTLRAMVSAVQTTKDSMLDQIGNLIRDQMEVSL